MDDPMINGGDDQLPEAEETFSLTDFPISQPQGVSTLQDHPSSAAGEDFFEFFSGGLSDNSDDKTMSHAEDIIFCGKLVPLHPPNKPPETAQSLHHRRSQQKVPNQPIGCRRSRSESTAEIKRTTTNQLVRNSRSLDYKKMNRNSSLSSEFTAEMNRDGSGKKSSSSSSRWYVLLFGLVKVPPSEMDIRDIKNRQVRRSSSKAPSESFNLTPVTSVDQRRCSWRVLGFLSCKSSSSAAVTTPVGYMPKA